MRESQLKIGLVTHWQSSGWHGLHQIVKFNNQFVYVTNPESKFDKSRISKLPKNTFLFQNSTGNCWDVICDYPETHRYLHCVGKVYPIGKPLPEYKDITPRETTRFNDGKYPYETLEDKYLTKIVKCEWGVGKVIAIDYDRLAIKLNKPHYSESVGCFYENEVELI